MLPCRKTDVDIGIQRRCDMIAKISAERLVGDAADDLADEEAECVHVIAVRGSRTPPWLLMREGGGDDVPLQRRALGEGGAEGGEAGLMRQHLPRRDGLLASLRELRPVARDRCVEVQLS